MGPPQLPRAMMNVLPKALLLAAASFSAYSSDFIDIEYNTRDLCSGRYALYTRIVVKSRLIVVGIM